MTDGSEWLRMAREVHSEQHTIPPRTQSRLANALQVELLTRYPQLMQEDKISISFPKTRDGKPAIRIKLVDSASQDDKRAMDNFIAENLEHYTTPSGAKFMAMADEGRVRKSYSGGYHGRCDTTISANCVDDLTEAVAAMITHPMISRELLNPGPARERD